MHPLFFFSNQIVNLRQRSLEAESSASGQIKAQMYLLRDTVEFWGTERYFPSFPCHSLGAPFPSARLTVAQLSSGRLDSKSQLSFVCSLPIIHYPEYVSVLWFFFVASFISQHKWYIYGGVSSLWPSTLSNTFVRTPFFSTQMTLVLRVSLPLSS